jgi:hypothetical protein
MQPQATKTSLKKRSFGMLLQALPNAKTLSLSQQQLIIFKVKGGHNTIRREGEIRQTKDFRDFFSRNKLNHGVNYNNPEHYN